MDKDYYKLETEGLLNELNTNETGLSQNEAELRIKEYGLNVLPKEKKETIIQLFFKQLKNPITIILFIAMVLSFFTEDKIEAIFIFIIILLDGILGTYQQYKAEKSAESLQNLIKIKTTVLRDNKELLIDSDYVTIGDIVMLDSGDKIAADMIIIDSHNLIVNESILTGESIGVEKIVGKSNKDIKELERKKSLYAGTSVIRGRAIAVVIKIGIDTEVGKIAKKVISNPKTKSTLVIKTEHFTKQIAIIILILGLFISLLLFLKGYSSKDIFMFVVALSVSAIPEGLPVALTLALSIASNRMAKRNMLVKKLNSVESLGSCTVIASDKTGTLTVNEQTAKIIYLENNNMIKITGVGYNDKGEILVKDNLDKSKVLELTKLGVLNNEAKLYKDNDVWKTNGDSIDIAFLALGYKNKVSSFLRDELLIEEIPYESENKFSAVFYKEGIEEFCSTKGALEKILEFTNYNEITKNKWLDKEKELASLGYRVITISKGKLNVEEYKIENIKNHEIIGLIGFIDPIREEVKKSINVCHNASIKTIMITGDHPLTAFHIGKELNIISDKSELAIGNEIVTKLSQPQNEFDQFIKTKKVFARVTPNQKYEIIESLKRLGEYVAVTGDGVNDAPALRSAHIGIAMGSGTDVAKDTGSMIMMDDNFLSIVSGIEEGRVAYDNIRKVIYMLLSSGIAELLFFVLSIILGFDIPLIAIQLLWLNLVTDGLQDIALSFERKEPDVMNKPPRGHQDKIFDKLLIQEILLSGLSTGIVVFIFWIYLINNNVEITLARSYIMLLMVFMQNIHVLNCRSETRSVFKVPFKDNPFVIISIMLVLILQFIVIETPFLSSLLNLTTVPYEYVFEIFFLAIPILFVMEMFKYFKFRKR